MKLTSRFSLFAIVTILVLILSLLTPAIVFADDETPPAPTEEPAQPPTDAAATEEPAPVQGDTTVAEVLDQLPDDTQIVVVNDQGETVPLASQEAADILSDADTDPMWCPAGVTTVTVDCVAKNTVTLLLPQLATKSGAGVIYFKASPNYNTNDVVFNQITNAVNLGNLTDLILQGGWNGNSTLASTITYSGQSVFTVPVTVVWNYNVTVNNFTVQNAASTGLSIDNTTAVAGDVNVNDSVFKKTQNGYDGLDVDSGGDITLTNVTANNNTGMGSSLYGGGGAVSVSGSTFNDNSSDGLSVLSGGEIDVNNATANRNGNNGAYLSGGGEVNLTGTNTFDANINNGLNVGSSVDINLNNVEANRNGGYGSYLDNCAWDGSTCTGSGNINLTGTNTFDANGISGLEISSTGDINLNNVEASRNTGGDGAYLDNTYGSGSIYFTGSNSFNDNEDSGLEAYSYGNITFDAASDTNANRNGEHGLYLYNANNAGNGAASITLNNIIANFNDDGHGVYAYASGDLTLTNGYSKGNDKRGVYAQSDFGNIDISLSDFINNGMSGLRAEAYNWTSAMGEGNITLDQVFSEKNGIHGANLGAAGDITITDDSEFINNDESGVHIMGLFGNLYVSESLFSGNDKHGLDAEYVDGAVNIDGSVYTFNKRNGLNLPDVSGAIDITTSDFLNNKHDGAYLYNCGCTISDITIDSSNFNDNGWSGLDASSYGEISLIDVMADGNLSGDGAYLNNAYGTGNIFVDPSQFNNNGSYGIEAHGNGDIDFSEVTADSNGNGVYLDTSGNATVCDSAFNNNTGYGIDASNVTGSFTQGNNTFSGNGSGDYIYGGSVSDCYPSSGGGNGDGKSSSSVIIPTTGGEKITCDRTQTSKTIMLSDGDFVTMPCPINEYAVVNSTSKGELPGALEDGFDFLSSLTALVIRDNQSLKSLENPIVVSFAIPAGVDVKDLTILFWDGTQWQDLGGAVSTDGLHFEVSTTQLGTFALAKK